jgi:dipeptidyl aminopeptidase/acylaminoacyl peptidase
VCIVGASYGGYSALAGAAFSPNIYQCAVLINGVADVERMLKKDKMKYGSDHWVVSYWEEVLKNGEFSEDHLAQISPINHIDKIETPVLLIHGEYDQIVPLEQSEDMFDALEDADKTVQFVELDEGTHHLSKGENRMKALKSIDAFLTKYLN